MSCSMCPPSLLSPAILREQPLSHWGVIVARRWVHDRQQGSEWAWRKRRQRDNSPTKRKQSPTSESASTRETVWAEWRSQRDGGGSEELNSKTAQFPDIILNIFCIKRAWRTHWQLSSLRKWLVVSLESESWTNAAGGKSNLPHEQLILPFDVLAQYLLFRLMCADVSCWKIYTWN